MFYNEFMYSKEEIAKKIVEFLMKKSVKNLDRNRKLLGLLKFLKLAELKNDFDSIYTHALVEYSVDVVKTEVVKLLAMNEVRQDFREAFVDDWQNNQLETTISHLLKNSKKLDILRKIYPSFEKIKPEIESFKEVFQRFTHKSRSPGEIKQYNEFNRFMMQMMEEQQKKSFHYQAEQYLIRLKSAFQKELLDNNYYIDLNGELRTAKKTRDTKEGEEPGFPGEKDYESTVYKPLDTFILQWLRDDNRNFLVILGNTGPVRPHFCVTWPTGWLPTGWNRV